MNGNTPTQPRHEHKFLRELMALLFIFFAILLMASLASYSQTDPGMNHALRQPETIHNVVGLFGAYLSSALADLFGIVAFIWPIFFALLALRLSVWRSPLFWWRWLGLFLLSLSLAWGTSAFNLKIGDLHGGGLLGLSLYSLFSFLLRPFGAMLLWVFTTICAVQLLFKLSFSDLPRAVRTGILHLQIIARGVRSSSRTRNGDMSAGNNRIGQDAYTPPIPPLPLSTNKAAGKPAQRTLLKKIFKLFNKPALQPATISAAEILDAPAVSSENPAYIADALAQKNLEPIPEWLSAAFDGPRSRASSTTPLAAADSPNATVKPAKSAKFVRRAALPDLDFLAPAGPGASRMQRDLLEEKGRKVMSCLADFSVQGELVGITPGPVVTMFEVRPAPGIKVNRIAGLADDLALALKAIAVRVQAPIPGTDTVGIEIPNEIRETVNFRELLASASFKNASSLLSIAIGKDIAGLPAVADLARMPHLLVAGATGAGKSVCLNSILLSLLYKARADDVRLLLIDPKRIELAVYEDLPHLAHPVVTEAHHAKSALDWAVHEMDRRYNAIARLGVHNIEGYNEKLASFGANLPENLCDLEPIPFLLIIIDELADLMLTASKEVETSIVRLAQLARAAGMHMILATQRPSVDVVTGLIKANFPCRISFQVTSKHDSRTILDTVGAEHLLGKGDMLFKPSGGRIARLHGAFVSEAEVAAVVDHWKKQLPPSYLMDLNDWAGGSENAEAFSSGADNDDAQYSEVVDFVRAQGIVSISLIQRRFRIGFNKAARYMEQMEKDGIKS